MNGQQRMIGRTYISPGIESHPHRSEACGIGVPAEAD